MIKPLIVGIDGSDPSLRAVDWAVREAARRDVPVRMIHASLWERYERMAPGFGTDRPSEQVLAGHIAASAARRASLIDPGARVSTEVVGREPVAALLAEADRAQAIVVGSRGRGDLAGMLLGSTGLGVAARAGCPVIVIRGGMRASDTEFGTVTVGVGAPGTSTAAVEFALAEAELREAELVALHAWRAEPGTGAEPHHAERLLGDALLPAAASHPKVTVHRRVPEGRPRGLLLDASRTSDLIVVGARHRQVEIGLSLGRVSHGLLHHADCPVAVVPQKP
jgi:nucleotide-binding universal stress UspA family protein